jgi:formate hydrogenlyase subunit 4
LFLINAILLRVQIVIISLVVLESGATFLSLSCFRELRVSMGAAGETYLEGVAEAP